MDLRTMLIIAAVVIAVICGVRKLFKIALSLIVIAVIWYLFF